MDLRDFIVTPILILLVYAVAWYIRPRVTDEFTWRYFLPALTVKIAGALALGILYQFYYDGGDTFNFHTHGSRVIWQAFMESPVKGLKLLFNQPNDYVGIYEFVSRIPFYRDPQSFAVIQIALLFDLITFSTYSATAVLFAVLSFAGGWLLFITFYSLRPSMHLPAAIATLFIPSVIFWGSGVLKDTITLACLGIATWLVYRLFIVGKVRLFGLLALGITLYFLFVIKIYILLVFMPSIITWIFFHHYSRIKSIVTKVMIMPFVLVMSGWLGYYAIVIASEANPKYSLSALSSTAQITAYDIRFWTGREAGSGYTLGDLDGTWKSMIALAPQSINVSLFRPYIWEVTNPLMLLSAMEGLVLLGMSLYVLVRVRSGIVRIFTDPAILFCFLFSVTFAFAVGVSTFNFGTLSRYKIPLLPFYLLALFMLLDTEKRERNLPALESIE